MDYLRSRRFSGTTVRDIRPKVELAFKAEGFGVLTEIDIQSTMKEKLGKEYLPHIILGTCNPVFADSILSINQHVSLLLPCNVSIRMLETNEIEIAVINPVAAILPINNPIIAKYAEEIGNKLNRALDNI